MKNVASPDVPMETSISFPVVKEPERGMHWFRYARLAKAFRPMGTATLSGLALLETAQDADKALRFLERATTFLCDMNPTTDGLLRPGYHRYSRSFSPNSAEAHEVKRAGASTDHAIERLSLEYLVMHGLDGPNPVGAVAVTTTFADSPIFRSGYTRLAYSADPDTKSCTLRVAVGKVSHGGMPVPDVYALFGELAGMGEKLAAYPADTANVTPFI